MINSRPQRLTRPAPAGSLLKRATAPTTTARPSHHGDADYLALVRQCPCLFCGTDPAGEAAHVKFSSFQFGRQNALGKRLRHEDALPLCRADHLDARHAQHKQNEELFWEGIGIAPYVLSAKLYAQRGDLVAMRAVVMVAISDRTKR